MGEPLRPASNDAELSDRLINAPEYQADLVMDEAASTSGGQEHFALDVECARLPLNDEGNSKRLKARANDDLLYVRDYSWHVWDGQRYKSDGGSVKEPGPMVYAAYCELVLQGLEREAAALEADPDFQPVRKRGGGKKEHPIIAALKRHRQSSGNTGKILAALQQAGNRLIQEPSGMDPDIFRFNCLNGTLALYKPGEGDAGPPSVTLIDHDKADLITRVGNVRFDPDAEAPTFRAFLKRILPDSATRNWLQRYLGYCLTGHTEEQSFAMLVGQGANGKSTLTETILAILGDYAATVPRGVLLDDGRRDVSKATPELAALTGVRMLAVGETSIGDKLDEGVVKNITGGEVINARKLFKDMFSYRPQFKIAWSMNNKPRIYGKDDGIWRRVVVVPFDQQIPERERDRSLKAKMLAESSGILNWLLDGFRMWAEDGVEPSEQMRAASDQYRQEQDPVGTFLSDVTERDPGAFTKSQDLYALYLKACRLDGIDPLNKNNFGRGCTGKGWERKRGTGNVHGYKDMLLNTDRVAEIEAAEFEMTAREARQNEA